MRALIEQRLAGRQPLDTSRERMLANVVGAVSAELLALMDQSTRQAAVLLGLIERADGLHLLLTERATHLTHHPGQISFPGGRLSDRHEGPVDAALREAREEVGLDPRDVSVAGCLDLHATGTGFSVTPVVGFIAGSFEPEADPAEVSEAFEVPLDFVFDKANFRVSYRERFGSRFRVYELDYGRHRIWGATASMLMTFRNIICDD
ncbi:NUDIX domain-containing protein [Candidatus Rariloculus sp.]|uniref:NUDIX hydrolase n=1 Tax=Candidatus Rariloculus sp. TaxID=3101265 RepID=UPI003D0A8BEA